MAVLGKRKARGGGETTTTSSSTSISAAEAEEIFRRHFEAQFDPLDVPASRRAADDDEDEDEDDDESDCSGGEDAGSSGEDEEWGGLSEDDDGDDDDSAEEGDEKDSSQRRTGRPGKRRAPATAVEVVDHSSAQAPSQTPMTKKELRAFMVRQTILPPYTHNHFPPLELEPRKMRLCQPN